MPRQTKSQAIGREGEKWFFAQLPSTWIPQRPSEDVGVDALVVICEDGPLNGLEFRVQIKSNETWTIKDGEIIVKGFRRESLLDLIHGFTPALLVSEDECLAAFPAVRLAIELILDNMLEEHERNIKLKSAAQSIADLKKSGGRTGG